jgi:hypothetical protein
MKERLNGLFVLFAGVLLGYISVYQPLESARQGAPTVRVSLMWVFPLPLALIGVTYLALGPRATEFMGTRENRKPSTLALVIGLLLVGVGL